MLLNSNPVREELVQREIHTRQWIFKNRSQMFFKKKKYYLFLSFYLFIHIFFSGSKMFYLKTRSNKTIMLMFS